MKKLLAITLLLVTLFSMVACNFGGDGDQASLNESSASESLSNSASSSFFSSSASSSSVSVSNSISASLGGGSASSSDGGAAEPLPDGSGKIVLGQNGVSDYKLVYGSDVSSTVRKNFINKYNAATGTTLEAVADADASFPTDAKLILLGDTKYAESNRATQGMRNKDWIITQINNKIVINGTQLATSAVKDFYDSFSTIIKVNNGVIEMLFTQTKSNYNYAWNTITIQGKGLQNFTIVYADSKQSTITAVNAAIIEANKEAALALQKTLEDKFGYTLPVKADSTTTAGANEILIGLTNRAESTTLKTTLNSYQSYDGWATIAYKVLNGKLCIYGFMDSGFKVIQYWLNDVERSKLPETNENHINIYPETDRPRVFGILRASTYFGNAMSVGADANDAKKIALYNNNESYYETIMGKGMARYMGTGVRIMTANIESEDWINGGKPSGTLPRDKYYHNASFRVDSLMHTLATYRPDVVGLQEVSSGWHTALAGHLGDSEYGIYADGTPSGVSGYKNYCPVLYNKKTVKVVGGNNSYARYTSASTATMARILTTIVFEVIDKNSPDFGKQFVVLNTHWDTLNEGYESRDNASRLAQAKQMAEKAAEMYKKGYKNVFCMGDLNTKDATTDANGQWIMQSDGVTYTPQAPYTQFLDHAKTKGVTLRDSQWVDGVVQVEAWRGGVDHIFCTTTSTPLQYIRCRNRGQQEVAGDHPAIICDFKLG